MRRAVVKYYLFVTNAIVAQLVERHLAKVEIAGSSPVYRSKSFRKPEAFFIVF